MRLNCRSVSSNSDDGVDNDNDYNNKDNGDNDDISHNDDNRNQTINETTAAVSVIT